MILSTTCNIQELTKQLFPSNSFLIIRKLNAPFKKSHLGDEQHLSFSVSASRSRWSGIRVANYELQESLADNNNPNNNTTHTGCILLCRRMRIWKYHVRCIRHALPSPNHPHGSSTTRRTVCNRDNEGLSEALSQTDRGDDNTAATRNVTKWKLPQDVEDPVVIK